jgi:hypothetical protein
MLEPADYSAFETLRDGRRIEIRALRSDDRADLIAAVARSSGQSLYRRFFAVRRDFTEPEIRFFLNVDFVDHVALVAVADESGRAMIAGGGRYVVVRPGKAEVHLAAIALSAGLRELIAEVLPDNIPIRISIRSRHSRHNDGRVLRRRGSPAEAPPAV